MVIVQVRYLANGNKYFLAGTTWTTVETRATRFADEASAKAGFAKAMKFTKPRLFAQTYTYPEFLPIS